MYPVMRKAMYPVMRKAMYRLITSALHLLQPCRFAEVKCVLWHTKNGDVGAQRARPDGGRGGACVRTTYRRRPATERWCKLARGFQLEAENGRLDETRFARKCRDRPKGPAGGGRQLLCGGTPGNHLIVPTYKEIGSPVIF